MRAGAATACLLAALVALSGCDDGEQPERRMATSNASYQVARLFTHEGCTVYRFSDGGYSRYFVRCANGASAIGGHGEYCGKGCVRQVADQIETVSE